IKYNLSKNQEEQAQINQDLATQKATAEKIQKEITATQQEIDQKQKLLTDFDTQLNKINHQEQELQTKLAVIKNNHANESNQNSYLKESISQATEQISELQGKLNDLDSEKNQLDLSNTEVKNRIKECQTEIKDLQDVVAKLKAE